MSKATLIIDTPNNCYECPCFMDEGWRCQNRLDIDEEVHDGRPSWCPLIEADAVPVIRCKDCQFNYGIENGVEFNPDDIVCTYFATDGMEANDYCSKAERKEE